LKVDGSDAVRTPSTCLLDRQGWITVVAGLLLALITLFTSYSHVNIVGFGAVRLNQQIGVPLLAASLATLVVDAELAARRRLRAEGDRIRAAQDRAREADEALRRARRQDGCTLAQLQFQLDPGPVSRQRLADLIALLREYGDLL